MSAFIHNTWRQWLCSVPHRGSPYSRKFFIMIFLTFLNLWKCYFLHPAKILKKPLTHFNGEFTGVFCKWNDERIRTLCLFEGLFKSPQPVARDRGCTFSPLKCLVFNLIVLWLWEPHSHFFYCMVTGLDAWWICAGKWTWPPGTLVQCGTIYNISEQFLQVFHHVKIPTLKSTFFKLECFPRCNFQGLTKGQAVLYSYCQHLSKSQELNGFVIFSVFQL